MIGDKYTTKDTLFGQAMDYMKSVENSAWVTKTIIRHDIVCECDKKCYIIHTVQWHEALKNVITFHFSTQWYVRAMCIGEKKILFQFHIHICKVMITLLKTNQKELINIVASVDFTTKACVD